MVAWGKDKSESRVTAEFYNCAVEVMRGAEAIDEYIALPQQEAFDIEYWLLEEAKLQRMPAEKELARQVHIVIGAGSGIGKETAHRLVKEGAHIVCVDLNEAAAKATADEITAKYGLGIGVAGTGLSGCGVSIGLSANITDRASIRAMLDQVALAYGGFDSIEVTAGIFVPSDTSGHIPDDKWALTFNINVTGSYFVADEAAKTWREQGLRGNLVLTTSANAVVAKKGSLAYDTSKAAANHLVRELAIELSPLVRVNGVAPATVVQGSAMFPRDRVIGSLAKYGIPYTDDEATESLVSKLAQFLRGPHTHEVADHPGRPGGSLLPPRDEPPQQDDRPGDHRGRRPARGLPAVGAKNPPAAAARPPPRLRAVAASLCEAHRNPGRANLPVSRRFPTGEGTSFSHPRLGESLALPEKEGRRQPLRRLRHPLRRSRQIENRSLPD